MKGSFSQKAGKTGWVGFVCLLCLVISSIPIGAASASQNDPALLPGRGELPEMTARAKAEGTVRVVVALRAPADRYVPEAASALNRINAPKTAIALAQDAVLEALDKYDVKEVKKFQFGPYMSFEVDAAGLAALAVSDQVEAIGVDRLYYPSLMESAAQIGALQAWNMGATGAGQTIAIIDSGVDKNHPFLRGKVVSEACYSTTSASESSTSLCPGGLGAYVGVDAGLYCSTTIKGCEHGTHVAGIAVGKGMTFSGIAKDASIVAIQAASRLDSDAQCLPGRRAPCTAFFFSDLYASLERVYTLHQTSGLKIAAVNFSGGSTQVYQPFCDNQNITTQAIRGVVEKLRSAGIATIVAAGNASSTTGLSHPACLSNVISIGSTSDGSGGSVRDAVSAFSNCAVSTDVTPTPSLMAPGEVITSSVPGVGFSNYLGTSMAAPHVAGAWAVIRGVRPNATIDQILGTLQKTGYSVTDRCNSTISQIQLDDALRSILYELPGAAPTTVVTTTTPSTTFFPTSSTIPSPGAPYIMATPSWCQIPVGQAICGVSLQVYNPSNRSVQVWSRSPDNQEVPVTGIIATTYFGLSAPWITAGNFLFSLYDVSGGGKTLLASTAVTGVASNVPTTTPTTWSPTSTTTWTTTTTVWFPPTPTTTLPSSDLMLNVSCPRAAPGVDIVVPISLATIIFGQGPVSIQGDLSYDPALMTYLGSSSGPSAINSFKEVGVGLQYPGRLRFLVSGQNQSVIGDGILFYLTFRINPAIAAGTSLPMICSDTRAYNLFGQIINLGCASCSLPTQASTKRILR